ILANHDESITNDEVRNLISNKSFFTTCHFVCLMWEPIKEIIHMLEANITILADCFVYLIKLATAINNLSETNSFKSLAIHVFNRHYEKFLHPLYILAYYIHPEYR
ncbi:597_t:CDS:1, partial [Racocetra persica]